MAGKTSVSLGCAIIGAPPLVLLYLMEPHIVELDHLSSKVMDIKELIAVHATRKDMVHILIMFSNQLLTLI